MVEPRLTPAQKPGANPFLVAASTERPSTRAGSVSPSTRGSANEGGAPSGAASSSPPKQPVVVSASAATTATEQPIALRTNLPFRQLRLRGLFEPFSRHDAPVAPSPQQVDEAAAPEIGGQLVVAQALGHGVGDEARHVPAALVSPIRVLLEQQRGDRDDHCQEDRDGQEEHEERNGEGAGEPGDQHDGDPQRLDDGSEQLEEEEVRQREEAERSCTGIEHLPAVSPEGLAETALPASALT